MLLSEEQARTKWCPWDRHADDEDNRIASNQGETSRCIGSNCMQWRWARAKETQGYVLRIQEIMREQNIDFRKASQEALKDIQLFEETEGYCGVAGKPGGAVA